jgi:hypothetical protein
MLGYCDIDVCFGLRRVDACLPLEERSFLPCSLGIPQAGVRPLLVSCHLGTLVLLEVLHSSGLLQADLDHVALHLGIQQAYSSVAVLGDFP